MKGTGNEARSCTVLYWNNGQILREINQECDGVLRIRDSGERKKTKCRVLLRSRICFFVFLSMFVLVVRSSTAVVNLVLSCLVKATSYEYIAYFLVGKHWVVFLSFLVVC